MAHISITKPIKASEHFPPVTGGPQDLTGDSKTPTKELPNKKERRDLHPDLGPDKKDETGLQPRPK
jgi:hypothetical protein